MHKSKKILGRLHYTEKTSFFFTQLSKKVACLALWVPLPLLLPLPLGF